MLLACTYIELDGGKTEEPGAWSGAAVRWRDRPRDTGDEGTPELLRVTTLAGNTSGGDDTGSGSVNRRVLLSDIPLASTDCEASRTRFVW